MVAVGGPYRGELPAGTPMRSPDLLETAPVWPRRIGVNAVFLEPGMGGIEVYAREILPRIAAQAPGSRVTVVCNPRGRELLGKQAWPENVELVSPAGFGVPGTKAISELTVLGAYASRRFDVLLSLAMTGPLMTRAASVIFLPDLTWLKFADLDDGDPVTTRLWRLAVPAAARRASRLIAPSEATKSEIVSLIGVEASRIDVIPHGFDAEVTAEPTPDNELRGRLGLGSGPLILNVAAKKSHKNLVRLVQALALVREREPDAQLVLPGAPTGHDQAIRKAAADAGVDQAVHLPGFVNQGDLEGLYRAADCFAFPSISEGFGVPLLEAMARDLPVVCSNVSAMPEVVGDAAVLVDPYSPESLAQGVSHVLADEGLRSRLVAAGRARLEYFRWDRFAMMTLETLAHAVSMQQRRVSRSH